MKGKFSKSFRLDDIILNIFDVQYHSLPTDEHKKNLKKILYNFNILTTDKDEFKGFFKRGDFDVLVIKDADKQLYNKIIKDIPEYLYFPKYNNGVIYVLNNYKYNVNAVRRYVRKYGL